tara:strand:- start:10483 stop:11325 length:843 start_codon:yes stop_codon:yes gene_type:complete
MIDKRELLNETISDKELAERGKTIKCYKLPLAPQDLVAIYKEKEEKKDYILYVDYMASKEKLSAKHIMIYLANTNFKTGFSCVDEDLIREYITTDFMVDSPILCRFITIIIRLRLHYDVNDADKMFYKIWPEDQIHKFIENNFDLVNELIETIRDTIPFAMHKLYETMPEEDRVKEVELKSFVDDIVVVDKPSNCGPNIARFVTEGLDGFLCITHMMGLSTTYNKSVFNDSPKYFGRDLYYVLNHTKMINQIMSFFPPWFWVNFEIADLASLEIDDTTPE